MLLDHTVDVTVAQTNNGLGDAMGSKLQPRRNIAEVVSGKMRIASHLASLPSSAVHRWMPLPADQIRTQAMSTQFSGFFEFGRRDRIPSPVDPRTKLIDQAMVGQGLIKPEELVRIHELGLKMDELRPELVGAHTIAQRAVQADQEAKQRIKAEKKAAAEQRKKDHAARVAANKLNDIIHLGRGVSKGLADRRSNIEKLQQQGLPLLSTPADVANALA